MCEQWKLLGVVNEKLLCVRRAVSYLIFSQKPVNGKVLSANLLNDFFYDSTRLRVYYGVPNTFHHSCSLSC